MQNEIRINYLCPECLYHEQLMIQITGKSSLKFNPGITTRATCTQCGTVMFHTDENLLNAVSDLLEKRYYIYDHCSHLDGVVHIHNEHETDSTVCGPYIVFGSVFKKERDVFNQIMHNPDLWITRNTLDAMFNENGDHVSTGYTFGDGNTISLMTRIEKDSDRKEQLYGVACAAICDIIRAFINEIDTNNPKRRASTSIKDRAAMGFRHRYIQSKKFFDSDMQAAYESM